MAFSVGRFLSVVVFFGGFSCTEQTRAESSTLQKIKSRGTITFGYREASIPFSYLGTDQKPTGMSLDLCAAVAERIRATLKVPGLKTDLVPVNASNRIPLIQNGTIDIECGSTTNTLERQKQVAFSVATFVSQPRWLTMRDGGIADVEQLRGRTVVITQGSLNIATTQKLNAEGYNLTVLQGRDHAESLLMLKTGRAAAWFEDDVLLASARATASDPAALTFLQAQPVSPTYYALMSARDDTDFKSLVDDSLKELMSSGKFDTIYHKWFTSPIPPSHINLNLSMSQGLHERVSKPSDVLE